MILLYFLILQDWLKLINDNIRIFSKWNEKIKILIHQIHLMIFLHHILIMIN